MAVRVQNFPRKTLGQNSISSMPHFASNQSSWWSLNEQQLPQTLSKNLSLRVKSSPLHGQEVGHSVHQLQDRGSPSTQSSSQSQHEVTVMGKTNSQDQCVSSESVQNQGYRKHVEEQMKARFLVSNAEFSVNPSQLEMSLSAAPITYADPYFTGLLNAYGPPQTSIQPQMIGVTPARIPLPPDVAQDSPIYVNAKQYHGILRRRQMRAKLEAQNKAAKNRKPYLHESRHRHALNRVRGSGGRFLSTKKQQHSRPNPPSGFSASVHSPQNKNMLHADTHRLEANEHDASTMTNTACMGRSDGGLIFQRPDTRVSKVSSPMSLSVPGTGGFACYGYQHRASGFR